jgi:hypothetical protein
VEKQDHAETDSNKRIYYKVPSQLEKHYKKTVARRATRSTVMMGSNAAALEPLRQLLAEPNTTTVLHARSLPDHCYSEQGKNTVRLVFIESDLDLQNSSRSRMSLTASELPQELVRLSCRSSSKPTQRMGYVPWIVSTISQH